MPIAYTMNFIKAGKGSSIKVSKEAIKAMVRKSRKPLRCCTRIFHHHQKTGAYFNESIKIYRMGIIGRAFPSGGFNRYNDFTFEVSNEAIPVL